MNEFKKKIGKNPEHDPQWQQKRKWQIPWKLFPCKPIQQNRSLIKNKQFISSKLGKNTLRNDRTREKKKRKAKTPSSIHQSPTNDKPKINQKKWRPLAKKKQTTKTNETQLDRSEQTRNK